MIPINKKYEYQSCFRHTENKKGVPATTTKTQYKVYYVI